MRRLLAFLLLTAATACADWPHWRGPTMNGVAGDAAGLPSEWGPEQNVVWRRPLPGPAGSTPVIAGDRVFLTTPDGSELLLCAFDAGSGDPLWRRTVSTGEKTMRGDEGNLASPSPSTDGRHVVTAMGDGRLACYTVAGEPVWNLSLSDRLTPLDIQFGYASSPIVHDGRVYVQWVHGDGNPATAEARVACFDLLTGETVWSVGRETGAKKECEHAYTSPILTDDTLITHGADAAVAYALEDGAERWRLGGLNPPGSYHPTLRFVTSPAVGDSLLLVPTAKKGQVVAAHLGDSSGASTQPLRGDLAGTDREAWRLPGGTPDVPSPVVSDGLVYLCGENGNVACHDAATGRRLYRKRTTSDRFRASPLLADGKLYVTSRSGVVTVIRAGRDFEVLAQNDLGEAMSSSPVPHNGRLYLRTFEALWAIGGD